MTNDESGRSPSPIADLSYRGYEGPLEARTLRWWIIALANIRMSIRKAIFWVLAAMSGSVYLAALIALYIRSLAPPIPGARGAPWPDYLMMGLPTSLFFLFLLTLMLGSGSIASDSRANALLVYLSKPITKSDYLIGKWVGVFVLLFGVAFAPALLVYVYGLLTFSDRGFFTSDRLLLGRVVLVSAIAAGLHTSLILGFSAWSKSARMAGGLYAAFYFLTMAVAGVLFLILVESGGGFRGGGVSQQSLTVGGMSVPGLIQGLAQHVYDRGPGAAASVLSGGSIAPPVRNPALLPVAAVYAALVIFSLMLAHSRIRAVEVVRG